MSLDVNYKAGVCKQMMMPQKSAKRLETGYVMHSYCDVQAHLKRWTRVNTNTASLWSAGLQRGGSTLN